MAVTTLAEAFKPKCGGHFSAVGSFSFFGGNDFGGGGKPKHGGHFLVAMPYGGDFSAGSFFSFFGGNVNEDSKLGGKCGA